MLETRSDASPDREVGEGAEPGSRRSPPLAADGEHPSFDQVLEGESVGARVPDSDSEVESPQEAGEWMHHRGLLEGDFSDCESSLSHADTEVCDSPQADEVGLGFGDLCRAVEFRASAQAFDPSATASAERAAAAAKAECAGVEKEAAARADATRGRRSPLCADLDTVLRHKTRRTLHYGHKDSLSLLGCKLPRTDNHVPFFGDPDVSFPKCHWCF